MSQRLERAFAGAAGEMVTTVILYVAAAGLLWVAFYVLLRRRLAHRKVGVKVPDRPQVRREVLHSLRSIFVFASLHASEQNR